MEKNTEKKDERDEFSETRVLERLTDSSYDEKEEEKEDKVPEFESETQILERMTDPEPKEHPVKEEPKQEEPEENNAKHEVLSFLRELIVCVVTVFLFTNFIFRPVQVVGSSMYPTLNDGALGVSNVLGYNTSPISRFDIVIIYIAEKNEYIVKRVVGLPGETVSYQNGKLYIDGEYVEENFFDQSYLESYNGSFMTDIAPITLKDDEYYCLGDNRPHSSDSRVYGPFKKENIKSKGICILFPFEHFGVETW